MTSHPLFMQITTGVYARGKMAEFVALQKVKPVGKDVFYVEMLLTVRGKG